MTVIYIITKTQTRNNGQGYPVTLVLYTTTSKEEAIEEFQKVTSHAKPHRMLSDIFIEEGAEITSTYCFHAELMFK